MIPSTEERIEQLSRELNTRLKCLASMRRMGSEKYTSDGRWAREAHDVAELIGLPGKPLRPATTTWTLDAESVALEQLRDWLSSQLYETLPSPPKPKPQPSRRRAPSKPKPLTARQAEALQLFGECKGNYQETARRMGVVPKTVRQHVDAALKKLGQSATDYCCVTRTQKLPVGKRGEPLITDG